MAYRPGHSEPNQAGWTLRVISNKFPALKVEGDLERRAHGMYDQMSGIGAHEVIIETADHARDMVDLTDEEAFNVFWAFRERMLDLERDHRLKYVLVFKNHGEAAGASLEHSHCQLIATPIIPKRVMEEIEGCQRYFRFKERCIYCDIVRQELQDHDRLVRDHDAFIAIQPYAPRFPFETWVVPKAHQSSFTEMSEAEFRQLAKTMKDTLRRLKVALNDPPYNFILHTRPISKEHQEYYHWHFEIIPKLTKVAGFEWGSGFYINTTTPEEAAAYLKTINPDDASSMVSRAAAGDHA